MNFTDYITKVCKVYFTTEPKLGGGGGGEQNRLNEARQTDYQDQTDHPSEKNEGPIEENSWTARTAAQIKGLYL